MLYTPPSKNESDEGDKKEEKNPQPMRKNADERPYAFVLCIPRHQRKKQKIFCPFSDDPPEITSRVLRDIRTACVFKVNPQTLKPIDSKPLILGSTSGSAVHAHNQIRSGLVELLQDAAFVVTATYGVEERLLELLCAVVQKQPTEVQQTAEKLRGLFTNTLFLSTETLIQTAAGKQEPCIPLRHQERDGEEGFVLYVHKVFGGVLARNHAFRQALAKLLKSNTVLHAAPKANTK